MNSRYKLLFFSSVLFLAGLFIYFTFIKNSKILGVTSGPDVEKQIQTLIPENAYLREYVNLPELGPKTYLALYATDTLLSPEITEADIGQLISCSRASEGRYLQGNYHLAMVEDGKIIGEKLIPGYTYPIEPDAYNAAKEMGMDVENIIRLPAENLRGNMYWEFGDPQPVNDKERYEIVSVKLLRFADYNGDGLKNDIKFLGPTYACGHTDKLIAGYTPDKQVHIYPIEMPDGETYNWVTRFAPTDTGIAKQDFECGDHGSNVEEHNAFVFDRAKHMFTLTSHEKNDCTDL